MATGVAYAERGVYSMLDEVGQDLLARGIVSQRARPGAAMAELGKRHQRIGRIAAASHVLTQGAHLVVFPGVDLDPVDYVQRRNAHAQHAGGRVGSRVIGHGPGGTPGC